MNHLPQVWQSRMVTTYRTCSTAVDRQRMMPFERYRKLRRRLKSRSRVAGVPGALAGVALSSAVNVHFHPQMLEFQNPEAELTHILGMDPLAFAVLCGIGSGTVGFLFGGSVFNVIWNIVFKNRSKELQQ
ncbi:hypothetical protein GBAR_LOCUS23373 [Geodia barretti]|nr:hypothetical protein GBAR_LOCUS23373 [Geodia barretti]